MKKTILVVEDNFEVRENTIELLELNDFQTYAAKNGSVGFDMALKKKPDVIICDISMPETNGLQMLELLKANEATKDIPLIFFSAGSAPFEVKQGILRGANEYVSKPFLDEDLLSAIHRCLNGKPYFQK